MDPHQRADRTFDPKSGFTLVELVLTLVILGILAAALLPRFFDSGPFERRRFFDEMASAYRYAQKHAVVTGCDVQVQTGGNAYGLFQHVTDCSTGAFTLPVPHPSGSGSFAGTAPPGVTLIAPPTLTFDALGRASAGTAVTVGSRTFNVIQETGYVATP